MPVRIMRLPDGSRLGLRVELQTARNQDECDLGALVEDIELHGVTLPAGTMMSCHDDLPILYATLQKPHDFRGMHLPAGCHFEFTPTQFFLFPGLAIPPWILPLLIVYLLYRMLRRILLGTGPRTVRLNFPTEAGRPNPKIALYDVDPNGLPLAIARSPQDP